MDELKVSILDKENYTTWSIRTSDVLVQKNYLDTVEPGYEEEMKYEEINVNEEALTNLFLVLDDQFLDDIADCTRTGDAYISLKDVETKLGLLHILHTTDFLRNYNTVMKAGDSIITCWIDVLA